MRKDDLKVVSAAFILYGSFTYFCNNLNGREAIDLSNKLHKMCSALLAVCNMGAPIGVYSYTSFRWPYPNPPEAQKMSDDVLIVCEDLINAGLESDEQRLLGVST